jgi:hypothetical protein
MLRDISIIYPTPGDSICFYIAAFDRVYFEKFGAPHQHPVEVAVLMDGRVIKPAGIDDNRYHPIERCYSEIDGHRYVSSVMRADFGILVDWDWNKPIPALTPAMIKKEVLQYLNANFPRTGQPVTEKPRKPMPSEFAQFFETLPDLNDPLNNMWLIKGFYIKQIDDYPPKWVYIVEFDTSKHASACNASPSVNRMIVLLDGTIMKLNKE